MRAAMRPKLSLARGSSIPRRRYHWSKTTTTANMASHNCFVPFEFAVHSTFRDHRGRQLLPDGLEWGLPGKSVLAFVPLKTTNIAAATTTTTSRDNVDSVGIRLGILHAYNRWLFAKDLPLARLEDIKTVTSVDRYYYYVEWKDVRNLESAIYHENVAELVDKAAGDYSGAQVWINGQLHCDSLTHTTVQNIVKPIQQSTSRKLCFKTSQDGQAIRIDRYFKGGLYHRSDVFDHILDNLIALEDVHLVNDLILLGTATLPDWIMGGELTSRLYVELKDNGNILFLRPLHNDDIGTSDRRFELQHGPDDDKIAVVRQELERLRHLATLPYRHPIINLMENAPEAVVVSSDSSVESERARQHRRNHRKTFGF